ncbi:uncharacterized protein LOC120003455 isoform X2 [Tripterygium wilfordii]|uniref:uncharacterized protein LOC120003455 isoform X2 n=1 Tax=Tripterygium wilfordii TaxID=458696 RepID=UPI0018F861A5|nr:uncharacterized protein LOC120003455 isoform X2 [Tripterygium wilfordii]
MANFFKNFTIKTKYRAVVATATPIVIFSGIWVAWAYIHPGWKRRGKPGRVLSRSMSFGVLHGGQLALERLVDYHKARADAATLEAAEIELRNLISEEQPDFKRLQGDYWKALKYKCLKDEAISDDRRPLYKAILYVMVEDSKEAKKNWEEFQELRTLYQWPPGMQEDQIYKVITDFEEFEKVVRLLREDIKQVHEPGTKKF